MNFKEWLLSEMPVISLQGKTALADDSPLKEVDVDNIKNNINTKMIQFLQNHFPNAKLSFSSPTEQGKKFISSYTKKDNPV